MSTADLKPEKTRLPEMGSAEIEFAQRGHITIPKKMRDRYNIVPGQQGTVIDLGGVFLVTPKPSHIDEICDDLRDGLGTADLSLADMLKEMRTIRETSEYQA